jgi:hypothetical protein
MKILGKILKGGLIISPYNRATMEAFFKDPANEGIIVSVQSRTPESRQVRGFYHGAVLPLWAYLNGLDYRDSKVLAFMHEHAKREFNSEIIFIDGKEIKRGKSTAGILNENDKQNSGYLERVITYLEENYGIDRMKVLNPEHYKDFKDRVYSVGEYEDYIAYLESLGFLTKPII